MNTKLIIGSTAMKHWWPDYDKAPKDIDYLCLHQKEKSHDGIEYHHADFAIEVFKLNQDTEYLDKDILYTLKISHLAWEGINGKWWKHLKDAVFMKNHGCNVHQPLFDLFYKEWQKRFGDKSQISLNKATEMFFKDGVRRDYDHDWLHDYFAIQEEPAYKKILTYSDKPLCSKELFDKVPESVRYYSALEEMFVVSFERGCSLPNAYKGLVTRMTKGWWNQFLIENAEILLDGFVDEKLKYKELKSNLNIERK